ncbi:hypothetical protein SAMN04488063_0589 [Halopelagius inordinatus]|uniref:Uncharacterized protein n=1 Tax=Halopelagius inordinatus TaxID=553467 RepID=A0A1I2M7R3_9EURY|nr:hypothetical protein [Halopelagius inordinatus]SFF86878.1 hypothetical protein SAMN04488063_0589 [Halopelagius inordinatus]
MALFQQDSSDLEEKGEEIAEEAPMSAGDPIATLAAGSVLLSWYQFYVKGNKESGIFVGLWAPTLLAAANYVQQKDIAQKFDSGLSFN